MIYNCNHDVHRFANGVVLARIDPVAYGRVAVSQYDRGRGVIVVERGTGQIREIMATAATGVGVLKRTIEGMW